MKTKPAYILAIIFLSLLTAGSQSKTVKLPKQLNLTKLFGPQETLQTNRQHEKILIQFWASWCNGCAKTMAQLATLNKSNSNFYIVSVDENINDARNYFKNHDDTIKHLRKRAYLDNNTALASSLQVNAIPTVMVIATNGTVLTSYIGHLNEDHLKNLKKLLRSE